MTWQELKQSFIDKRDFLIGKGDEFSMQHRAFNAVSLITLLLLIVASIINFSIGLYQVEWIIVGPFFMQAFFYYLSRFKKKFALSVITYAIFIYVVLILNYIYDGGINGPILNLFGLTLVFLIAFSHKKYAPIYVLLHITVACILCYVEYYYPNIITYPYKTKADQVSDVLGTFIMAILFLYFTINYILSNYRIEKQLAEKRAIELDLQHQQIVAQKQKLEQLNEEKNKLFSIISHDLRSPVNSMQGYLELMLDSDLSAEESEHMKQELLDLTKNTSHMLQNLLLWSQAQMKGAGLQLKPVHLKDILTKATEYQKSIAIKKGIALEIKPFTDKLIYADSDMLELVIRNLVNNAIKFTPSGGQIGVEVKNIGDNTEISVMDNGIGINKDKQQELFKSISKSSYGTDNEKGMGLGLMLCKEYIEMQFGKISFESQEGQGSIFRVHIPNMK